MNIRRRQPQRQARQPTDCEHRQKSQRKQHRRVKPDRGLVQGDQQGRQDDHRRNRNDHRRRGEKRADRRAHSRHEHVVGPDDERHEPQEHGGVDQSPVAPQRLTRVVGDDLGDHPKARKNQHVHLRVGEKPEQVLPEQRAAATGHRADFAADHQTRRHEKARIGHAIHELKNSCRLQRRKRQQQQKRSDKLCPDEERQPHHRQPLHAQLNDRDDEVDRAQQRRGNQKHHADKPPGLAHRGDVGQRWIGGPSRTGRPARHEEAAEHGDAAEKIRPVTHHVDLGERHVGRADLQRHNVVPKPANHNRHDPEKDHDRAVHGPERVVEVRRHDAARHEGFAPIPQSTKHAPQHGDFFERIRKLPAHQHHEAEAEEQETQPGDGVLYPDDLVVNREDVFTPPAQFLVMMICHL